MKIFNTFPVLAFTCAVVLGFSAPITAMAATAIDLGTAGSFAVLGGSTVTNTGPSIVNGDMGLSPGTSVTGFPPGIVNGAQHITDAVAAQSQSDLVTAYNAASGQSAGVILISGDLGGQIFTPGLYKSASSLGLTGTVTLDAQGNPNAVFVFQVGSALTTASASNVNLVGGAQACNVFWQIGSSATLGTHSNFVGTIMALSSITVNTGTSISGRVLARTGAVTLDTNPISKPTCVAPVVVPPPVPATTTSTITAPQATTSSVAVIVTQATTTPPVPTALTMTLSPVAAQAVTQTPSTVTTPVAATSIAIPNSPNTGAGGSAFGTIVLLVLSLLIALGGALSLRSRTL